MSKSWQAYARHILDAIAKIDRHIPELARCIQTMLALDDNPII